MTKGTCPFHRLGDNVDLLKDGYLFARKQREQRGGTHDDGPLWLRLLLRPTLLV
ncbi:MAG TPA: hypothetical protein GX013_04905, partial [Propionibacterium sp.]|nr:hypothetical protein [Propionibacterium sp.]